MKRKKRGRPSLVDLQKRNLKQQQEPQTLMASIPNFNSPNSRSTRRNPINRISPAPDYISSDGVNEDDDDERKEKKVKLVVRLPHSNQQYSQPRSSANSMSLKSASGDSDSNADGEKLKINATGDRSVDADQVEMVQKAMDTLQGLVSGPTTPLPDKKLLVFILDRLQKKDTYGVFSEPVDPDELPDYHEVIKHPMDFKTVRKKLDEGCYSSLDDFEADVFLICSNAMQYNSPDTVYFRQARSMHELAKRDFENLRQVNDDGEPRPKIVRRGRPPGKSLKKSLASPPLERVAPESSPDATLAAGGDNAIGSNSYNLRRVPMPLNLRSSDTFFGASHQSRNNETCGDLSVWNSEFPASILKAEAKYGKKQFSLDENRRATYKPLHSSAFGHEPALLNTLNGEMKQLMGVGLHSEHGYARSLARFAANCGPIVWEIASKKIERVLPRGVKFGPGWVGENEASPPPSSALHEQKSSNNSFHGGHPHEHANSSLPNTVEDVAGGIGPGPSFQTRPKHMLHSDRNGFNGLVGYDLSSQTGTGHVRLSMPTAQPCFEEASMPSQMLGNSCTDYKNITAPCTMTDSRMFTGMQPWPGLPSQHKEIPLPVPPDLNVRFQAPASPSSSLRSGSQQQPDLALQL